MADLSAVLRKTIDGLPKANPSMRAKVYEKARAAIARQIAAANPPLADEVVDARRNALEEAIAKTEAGYAAREAQTPEPPSVETPPAVPSTPPARGAVPRPDEPRSDLAPEMRRQAAPEPRASVRDAPPQTGPSAPAGAKGPSAPERARAEPAVSPPRVPAPSLPGSPFSASSIERGGAFVAPPGIEPRDGPDTLDAPFARPNEPTRGARASSRLEPPRIASTEPPSGLDAGAIPAADLTAPRSGTGARRAKARSRAPLFAGIAALLFAGAGTAAYVYLDDIRAALDISGASTVAATTTPAPSGASSTAKPSQSTPAETAAPSAAPGTEVAAVPGVGASASAPAGAVEKRRYTQRLMPDGTEVDEGPGASIANAFEEGTNIAAASPPAAETPSAIAPPLANAAPAAPAAAEEPAAQPATTGSATTPAVAQKAVFYEERSDTEAGTQRGGNVVWSVVQESPAEGQPPEPAIRAVADVPEENLKLTLTIRRNTDATLPASHVIELMFDTPPDFPGGSIVNVQRLALKPSEQARGEPLIGVAGKISDGFFIIALNNLSEATNTNLELLDKEQWIDIPIAYATGRRALISIEKGIPGERAFKEALAAWGGKT